MERRVKSSPLGIIKEVSYEDYNSDEDKHKCLHSKKAKSKEEDKYKEHSPSSPNAFGEDGIISARIERSKGSTGLDKSITQILESMTPQKHAHTSQNQNHLQSQSLHHHALNANDNVNVNSEFGGLNSRKYEYADDDDTLNEFAAFNPLASEDNFSSSKCNSLLSQRTHELPSQRDMDIKTNANANANRNGASFKTDEAFNKFNSLEHTRSLSTQILANAASKTDALQPLLLLLVQTITSFEKDLALCFTNINSQFNFVNQKTNKQDCKVCFMLLCFGSNLFFSLSDLLD